MLFNWTEFFCFQIEPRRLATSSHKSASTSSIKAPSKKFLVIFIILSVSQKKKRFLAEFVVNYDYTLTTIQVLTLLTGFYVIYLFYVIN